jgi:general secretion pathway protein I
VAGFSLLEAIVAMAILASAGMALFAAMSQSVQMVERAEAARERESAELDALAWIQTVNPALQPSGEEQLGDVLLHWSSEPVEPPRDASAGYLRSGLYQVGLYRVHLRLERDRQLWAELDLRRVGYTQVREPEVL